MGAERYRKYNVIEGGINSLSGAISANRVYVWGVTAHNNSGDDYYLQLFDTGSLPVATNVPRKSYKVAASGSLTLDFKEGREYATGSVYAWSSTYGTLTGGAFSELDVDFEFNG